MGLAVRRGDDEVIGPAADRPDLENNGVLRLMLIEQAGDLDRRCARGAAT